jgi:ribosomal protein S18 acetylase RimI-like enzyme
VDVVDWRDPSLLSFDAVWREESSRWNARLAWDSQGHWNVVERNRREGRLPGLALVDDGAIAGWTFFVAHQNTLQIGGFESRSPRGTALLLDAIDTLAEPHIAPDGVLFFAFSAAAGLPVALVERHYDLEHYLYLLRPLDDLGGTPPRLPWSEDAGRQLPSLFARAYDEPSLTRPFVRHGHAAEWQEYAAQLVQLNACGQFLPELSAASLSTTGLLQGAVLVTSIHPATAHVAQVSVDPHCQGRGLAQTMLRTVLARAKTHGFERVSLLVGERNRRARQLYSKLGFVEVGRFTSAGRGAYPRRSTSPAAETGGASTFR